MYRAVGIPMSIEGSLRDSHRISDVLICGTATKNKRGINK